MGFHFQGTLDISLLSLRLVFKNKQKNEEKEEEKYVKVGGRKTASPQLRGLWPSSVLVEHRAQAGQKSKGQGAKRYRGIAVARLPRWKEHRGKEHAQAGAAARWTFTDSKSEILPVLIARHLFIYYCFCLHCNVSDIVCFIFNKADVHNSRSLQYDF